MVASLSLPIQSTSVQQKFSLYTIMGRFYLSAKRFSSKLLQRYALLAIFAVFKTNDICTGTSRVWVQDNVVQKPISEEDKRNGIRHIYY